MCGIFGFIKNEHSNFEWQYLKLLARQMIMLSESRGKDASGLVAIDQDRMVVLKRPLRGRELIKSEHFNQIFDPLVQQKQQPIGFIGHTRMVTNGSAENHADNQPVIRGGMTCVHNGIIVNDNALWDQYALPRYHNVDTEVFLGMVDMNRSQGNDPVRSIQATMKCLHGANSFAVLFADLDALVLTTSNGSLYFVKGTSGNELLFASEQYILQKLIQSSPLAEYFTGGEIIQVKPGEGYAFNFKELKAEHFDLENQAGEGLPLLPYSTEKRKIEDIPPAPSEQRYYIHPYSSILAGNSLANEKLLNIDFNKIRNLRRCTRCLLPETFPFIEYDEKGVCNICNRYEPLKYKDINPLKALANTQRTSQDRPNCLVPVSGGRDSCFGLHYVVKELHLKPVAYTYDWGMVTDLARRNISRMCGALGIEHILISADIRKKRDNIRKNVIAWLKRPSLGTIPLFMAGDKQYFYYSDMLKKQMNLDMILFSMNLLERTDFKVAFAGINEKKKMAKHFDLNTGGKLRMMVYYGSEFLRNPAYINSSLLDTLFGYYSYYMIPKDYEILFEYIAWNEKSIEETIIGEYDWETSPDTRSTWRIGDGTASFYNYIYCLLAGFSENDTFRSNQIREGILTREQGLELIYEENQPRFESVKWYCNTIGVDMDSAIKQINQAPRLY